MYDTTNIHTTTFFQLWPSAHKYTYTGEFPLMVVAFSPWLFNTVFGVDFRGNRTSIHALPLLC